MSVLTLVALVATVMAGGTFGAVAITARRDTERDRDEPAQAHSDAEMGA